MELERTLQSGLMQSAAAAANATNGHGYPFDSVMVAAAAAAAAAANGGLMTATAAGPAASEQPPPAAVSYQGR